MMIKSVPLGCFSFSGLSCFFRLFSNFCSRLSLLLSRLSLQKFSGSILLAHTPNSFLFKGRLLCGRERERERENLVLLLLFLLLVSRRRRFGYRDKSNDTERERERIKK